MAALDHLRYNTRPPSRSPRVSSTTTIRLHPDHHNGPIDPRIYGGFLEHLGRAVYEGVYEPGHPTANVDGFRQDVIDALAPLQMPIMRYPGGNFVSCYDWKEGIGPRASRKARPDYAWQSIEPNTFGTDEFMKWAKLAKTEPMMAVNLGTAGAKEAGELLEYCNLPIGYRWSDERAKNGSRDPYGVKLWCLGNEMDGPWQAGHVPAEVYAQRAQAAGKLMKGLDPTIQTVVCGSSGNGMPTYLEYDRVCLEYGWNEFDYVSAHRYSENLKNDTPAFLAEGLEIDRTLEDYDGLLRYVRGMKKSKKNVYVSFDEWNVWYRARGQGNEGGKWTVAPHLLEEVYNFEDALVCAQYLHSFIRRADLVKVACIAQIANVIAPILTQAGGKVLIQSIFHPMALCSQNARGLALRTIIRTPTYKAGWRGEAPTVDAAVSYDAAEGSAFISLVNRDSATSADVTIEIESRKIMRVALSQQLSGDVKAHNTFEKPHTVGLHELKTKVIDGKLTLTIPAPGYAAVKVFTEAR